MTQTRMTRRHAVKFPPIIAAALALPPAAPAAATEAPTPPVQRTATELAYDCPEFRRLERELQSQLTDEQWGLHVAIRDAEGDHTALEYERLRDEWYRHFPGLAPAMRAVEQHLTDRPTGELGACCVEGAS